MSDTLIGFIVGLGSGLFSALMGACAKHATTQFTGADLLIFRMFWSAVLLAPFCWRRVPYAFKKDARHMWLRALFGSLGALCYFHSLSLTTLSMALLFWSVSPVFVILMAYALLGERLNYRQIGGAIAICASIFAIRYGAVEVVSGTAVLIGLAGAFFAACAYLTLKQVPKHFDPVLVVFMLSVFSFFIALPFSSHPLSVLMTVDRPELWGIAVANLGMQTLLTMTYRKLDASIAVLLIQSSLLWAAGLDYWLFGTTLTWFKLLMFAVIICGLILVQKNLPILTKRAARLAKRGL